MICLLRTLHVPITFHHLDPMQMSQAANILLPPFNAAIATEDRIRIKHEGEVEDHHNDLRDARGDLVGSRFRLNDQRNDLRKAREDTVAQVGKAYDLMRRLVFSHDLEIPVELQNLWKDVDDLPDNLGIRESD